MIFTKSIPTCDERKMAKQILLKEIDLMILFVNSAGINWLMQVHKQPWWITVLYKLLFHKIVYSNCGQNPWRTPLKKLNLISCRTSMCSANRCSSKFYLSTCGQISGKIAVKKLFFSKVTGFCPATLLKY